MSETDWKNTKIVEAESDAIDVKQYAGKRVKIEGVEEFDSQYERDNRKSFRVYTEAVDVIERGDGGDIHIRGSVILNLQVNEGGELAAYPGSRAHTFIKHYGVNTLFELEGKTCRVEPTSKGYLTVEVA